MKGIIKYIQAKRTNHSKRSKVIDIYNISITSSRDTVMAKDLKLISYLLKFTLSKDHLFCTINKWSDDIFINIFCKSNNQNWISCTQNMLPINELLTNISEKDIEDFLWLVIEEKPFDRMTIINDVTNFINGIKKEFQSTCSENSKIYFSKYSGVNSYKVIWGQEEDLNYIVYDLG